jgi:hypothetical protein
MDRIWTAVEKGTTPRLGGAFEEHLFRVFRVAHDLGHGNLQVGRQRPLEYWSRRQERRRELEQEEYRVYAMARKMYESENPVHRAVLKAVGQLPNLPADEFRKRSNEILSEEMDKSTRLAPESMGLLGFLPPIEDPTDQRIWDWMRKDPTLTDVVLGARLGLTRQALNARRRSLAKMGYPVRRVSRQEM